MQSKCGDWSKWGNKWLIRPTGNVGWRKRGNFVKKVYREVKREPKEEMKRVTFRTTRSNRVELLNNGGEMFASLIGALHEARHSIDLEYYIFDDDRIGRSIAEVLIRRARGGVRVRIIYDLLGSWMPAWGMLRKLRRAGVEVRSFRPFEPLHPWRWLNVRNHRKVAIIDNRVAFLGGINIARRYLEGNELGMWRDEHLRLEGPVVGELQRLFRQDWLRIGGTPYPAVRPQQPTTETGVAVRILYSQEGSTRRAMERELVRLIAATRRELLLTTPYYIPTPPVRRALGEALKRGVRIELMVPARADLRIAAYAAERHYGELLEGGARIRQYENGFLHTKLAISDRHEAIIGTANLDYRSLRINWEVAAHICDGAFARRAAETFFRDRKQCSELNLSTRQQRPLLHRLCKWPARWLERWL